MRGDFTADIGLALVLLALRAGELLVFTVSILLTDVVFLVGLTSICDLDFPVLLVVLVALFDFSRGVDVLHLDMLEPATSGVDNSTP